MSFRIGCPAAENGEITSLWYIGGMRLESYVIGWIGE